MNAPALLRFLSLLLASSLLSLAQFADLATNGDGSVLYFSTSGRLTGSNAPFHSKIYRINPDGSIELAAAVERQFPPCDTPCFNPRRTSNFYWLTRPIPSDDGTVVVYTGTSHCIGSLCSGIGVRGTVAVEGRPNLNLGGILTLSRNGRYVISSAGAYTRNPVPVVSLTDLSTRERVQYTPGARHLIGIAEIAPHAVSDEGTAVADPGYLLLITMNGLRRFPFQLRTPMIDRSGTLIVGIPAGAYNNSLAVLHVNSSESPQVIHSRRGALKLLGLSANGSRILFLGHAGQLSTDGQPGPRQLHVIGTDGNNLAQITNEPGGVLAGALSSNGRIVWYLSASSEFVQLDLQDRRVLRRVGRSPFLSSYSTFCPGSEARVQGAGLQPETTLLMNSRPVSLTYRSPAELAALIPADAAIASPQTIHWQHPGSPTFEFEQAQQFTPRCVPAFETLDAYPGHVWAIHEGSAQAVTPDNPASSGETIYVYARDLGPATPPSGLHCSISIPNTPVSYQTDTLSILEPAPAPGPAGLVRIGIRLPQDLPSGPAYLNCRGTDTHILDGTLVVR